MSDTDLHLYRVVAAFVRQEFGGPITTIVGLSEILIEDARSSGYDTHQADLDRIHSAGLSLQKQLGTLVNLAMRPAENGQDLAQFKSKLRHDLRTPLNAIKG